MNKSYSKKGYVALKTPNSDEVRELCLRLKKTQIEFLKSLKETKYTKLRNSYLKEYFFVKSLSEQLAINNLQSEALSVSKVIATGELLKYNGKIFEPKKHNIKILRHKKNIEYYNLILKKINESEN